jgi:hypothetical protein
MWSVTMQSFILSFLARSAFLGVLAGTTLVGFSSVGGMAIAAQPQNSSNALQSKDWVSQSLKSLIKHYKCESASKYLRSSDSPTRYMMAFALNECLDQMGFTAIQDSQAAQALLTELKKETQTLRASVSQDCRTPTLQKSSTNTRLEELIGKSKTIDRVESLDTRAATLEFQQFSTTTKFQGQAVVTFQGGGFR